MSLGAEAALLKAENESMEKQVTALEAELKEQKVIAGNCRRRAERIEVRTPESCAYEELASLSVLATLAQVS